MKPKRIGKARAAAFALFVTGAAGAAPAKEECLEAHGRGQDLREAGRLSQARAQFQTCGQQACPALVQSDCVRFAEELAQLVPTVTFVARDARAVDLPDTQVFLDEQLLAGRLDAGKPFELDPGPHAVRFVHRGRDIVLRVVINQGEKNRALVATFADPAGRTPPAGALAPDAGASAGRPALPLFVAGVGGLGLAAGAALFGVGLSRVPDACSWSSNECNAPPGDPSFEKAHDGAALANVGLAVGSVGLAVAVGGLVWYFVQSPRPSAASASLLPPRPLLGLTF
jgi:hypothetical protein